VKLSGVSLQVDDNQNIIQGSYNDMATRLEYNASGNLTYAGKAIAGSLSASAVWQIKLLQYDTAINDNISSVLWASGTIDYNKVWDNRSGLVYL
jgi:hypothetical protein